VGTHLCNANNNKATNKPPWKIGAPVTSKKRSYITVDLKGQFKRFFACGIFYESFSPKPMKINLGPFQIFSEVLGDICTGFNNTGTAGGKWEQYQTTYTLT
jgi:hypothetical protein